MLSSTEFSNRLSPVEKTAWNCFTPVVMGFLGNNRAENYQQLLQDLVKSYGDMVCTRMPFELHMLDTHLDKFKDNMGAYPEEQRERFHQDMKEIEQRYSRTS